MARSSNLRKRWTDKRRVDTIFYKEIMPRRHGWLQDYMYNLDQSEPRGLRDPGSMIPDPAMQIGPSPALRAELDRVNASDIEPELADDSAPPIPPPAPIVSPAVVSPAVSPVTINVNINLGDIIDRISSGRMSAKEAIIEASRSKRKKKVLNG